MGKGGGEEERCGTPGISRLHQLGWTGKMPEVIPLVSVMFYRCNVSWFSHCVMSQQFCPQR